MTYRDDEAASLRREIEDVRSELGRAVAERLAAVSLISAERDEAKAAVARLSKRDRLADVLVGGAKATAVVGLFVLVFVLVTWALATGGYHPPLAAGVVTDRYDDPAYTTPGYTSTVCTGTAPHRSCIPIYHPPVHHPEVWSIRIAHDGRDRVVEMSEDAWLATHVGGIWCERPPAECNIDVVEHRR